ncbi:MAG: hypothetical protein WAM14_25555 [Candidatus Nitrosopolaris sp.]
MQAKQCLSGNNLSISDGCGASDRRLKLISFKRLFEANEADLTLKEQINRGK